MSRKKFKKLKKRSGKTTGIYREFFGGNRQDRTNFMSLRSPLLSFAQRAAVLGSQGYTAHWPGAAGG
jgi:hypothetical protein